VEQVLLSRRAVRAFRPDPLEREQVADILRLAAFAPSNSNTQPWRVHVLTGEPMQRLGQALLAASREAGAPPLPHFPDPLPAEFAARQAEFAARYYGALGIDRTDAAARARQTERNFSFFGAPVGLIFTIDRRLHRHSWLDLGLFVQNVMIVARSRGIDTCPQVSFARFQAVIAAQLGLPAQEEIACGMAMGLADTGAAVNRMSIPRQDVEDFARFAGFEAAAQREAMPAA
jgi:nitroreductase